MSTRCCICLDLFELPVPTSRSIEILADYGFEVVNTSVTREAVKLIGVATYRRGAMPFEAPNTVDCSTLVWWAYAQIGINLPRYSLNQRACSVEITGPIQAGDIVFRSGYRSYYQREHTDGVGHVGIATGDGTIIHAVNRQLGVIESDQTEWTNAGYRGAGRILPADCECLTLSIPSGRFLQSSLDLRCMILQKLT